MTYGQPSSVRKWHRKSQILIALEGARRTGFGPLGRYQIQKIVYLGEVLAPLRGLLSAVTKFNYDKNGPYSGDVQMGVDHLVAIGLVKMTDYKVVSGRNREMAKYLITPDGTELVERLTTEHERHRRELSWLQSILSIVEIHGLSSILSIVYQEPTFKTLRLRQAMGAPIELDGESNETLALFSLAEVAINAVHHRKPDPEELLCLYFQYLVALSHQEAASEEQVIN